MLLLVITSLSSCSSTALTQKNLDQAQQYQNNPESLYPVVLQEATELEGKIIDGWFFQEDSRSLKSGYRDSTSAIKARFACDYVQLLVEHHEDLIKDWKSYVPYSVREKFARAWWSDPKHSVAFVKEPYYKQIIWLHEALMDGGELWWRALERKCPEGVASGGALGHDQEQLMVSKYKEDESSPEKSFSSFARPAGTTAEDESKANSEANLRTTLKVNAQANANPESQDNSKENSARSSETKSPKSETQK